MFKKLFFTSFLFFSLIGIYYPTKIENTQIFDYCHALEKILSRNSIQKRRNISEKVRSLSILISKFGVRKTKGSLINNMINKYKVSKNSLIINVIPNKIYCFSGYWAELVKPGTFEFIIYDKSKKTINEFIELKDEMDRLINNINSEYQNLREEFNSFFK